MRRSSTFASRDDLPFQPLINFTSGTAEYPWHRFLFWDIFGDVIGAALYIVLGSVFSDRILALDAALGDFSWMSLALLAALVLGWMLWHYGRAPAK